MMRPRAYGSAALAGCGAMLLGLFSPGCGDDSGGAENQAADSEPLAQGPAIERKSELGPVTATIKVMPEAPTLGDAITLTLEVTAEPGVTVMHGFGQRSPELGALGCRLGLPYYCCPPGLSSTGIVTVRSRRCQ